MRTLSIRQPWAWLIVRPDLTDDAARAHAGRNGLMKRVENRDWSTNYRGEFQIHAGVTATKKEYARIAAEVLELFAIEVPSLELVERGGIVGVAELVDVCGPQDMVDMGAAFQRWYTGAQGFILARARPLPFTPCKGQLGWFDSPRIQP